MTADAHIVFLVALLAVQGSADLRITRWSLTSTKYYEELTRNVADAPIRTFRFKRAEARDDGLEKCARESTQETAGSGARSTWCKAFAASIAPAFQFLLRVNEGRTVTVDSVVVQVHRAEKLMAGRGFYKDEALYDIAVRPDIREPQRIPLSKPLQFGPNGTLDLRLGFDLSGYGASPPPLEIDLTLTFKLDGTQGEVQTPRIRLQM